MADVVLPSLNAVSPEIFHAINRPHGRLNLAEMIKGLKRFRKEYRGQIWLEIMLVKGVNDYPTEITRLQKAIAEIKPDKVHLNTVVRPPAESDVLPLTESELNALASTLGSQAEVIALRPAIHKLSADDHLISEVVNLIARHPATLAEICEYVNCNHNLVWLALNALIQNGVVNVRDHQGKKYYAQNPQQANSRSWNSTL